MALGAVLEGLTEAARAVKSGVPELPFPAGVDGDIRSLQRWRRLRRGCSAIVALFCRALNTGLGSDTATAQSKVERHQLIWLP